MAYIFLILCLFLSVAETCYRLLYCSFVDCRLGLCSHDIMYTCSTYVLGKLQGHMSNSSIRSGWCALAYFFFFTVQERLCFPVQLATAKQKKNLYHMVHILIFNIAAIGRLMPVYNIQWDTSDVH